MGLLDFDISKITENPAFMLGTAIGANNTGHYGQFAPALSGGLNDYQRQAAMQKMLAEQKAQQEAQKQWWTKQAPEMMNAPADAQKAFLTNMYTPKKREMYKAADGYQYWQDTNERVNPNVVAPEKSPMVQVNMPGEDAKKEWDKVRFSNLANDINARRQGATDARATADQLLRLEQILNDPTFQTGPWETTKYKAEEALKYLGLNPNMVDNFANAQDFISGSGELVRQYMNQAKGPQTDADRAFLETIQPQYGKDKSVNQKLIGLNQSRNMLDSLFAESMTNIQNINDPKQVMPSYTQLSNKYMKAPAAVFVEGKPVYFRDYYRLSKQQNKSNEEIISGWLANVGEL